jgi:hypothetical protein
MPSTKKFGGHFQTEKVKVEAIWDRNKKELFKGF